MRVQRIGSEMVMLLEYPLRSPSGARTHTSWCSENTVRSVSRPGLYSPSSLVSRIVTLRTVAPRYPRVKGHRTRYDRGVMFVSVLFSSVLLSVALPNEIFPRGLMLP